MPKLRVLIVDDSVVIRRLVSDIISADSDLEVAGVAANGRIALDRIPQVNPDIITLDVEMPVMDGLETLKELRRTYPRLPVIMFSTMTERGGVTTLDALSLGASDYVTKPANVGRVGEGIARVRDDLIPKIKALCGRRCSEFRVPSSGLTRNPKAKTQNLTLRSSAARVEIVAIGTSTGGPNALADLLPELPGDFPVPVVIVQHMPPIFTKLLADRLAARIPLEIAEGNAGDLLKPGKIWIAPGDYHMGLERTATGARVKLDQEPPENSCRPAVDALFRSVVQVYGAGALGVILTGMGQDGLRGCEHIRDAGGQVLIQDEASSVVWGMPGFVARAGLADKELPLNQLGEEIVRRVGQSRAKPAGLELKGAKRVSFRG
jgi:two-component system, chemotaxis family, protein-glutamate methylesterase/glutaminase